MVKTPSTVARSLRYEGRVQGVGFRATVCELGRLHRVGGTVWNEPDGSVRLIAEGTHNAMTGFLAAIRSRFGSNLTKEQLEEASPQGLTELTVTR